MKAQPQQSQGKGVRRAERRYAKQLATVCTTCYEGLRLPLSVRVDGFLFAVCYDCAVALKADAESLRRAVRRVNPERLRKIVQGMLYKLQWSGMSPSDLLSEIASSVAYYGDEMAFKVADLSDISRRAGKRLAARVDRYDRAAKRIKAVADTLRRL